jgi:hypothetical protein
MAKSARSRPAVASFTIPIKLEIRRPKFKPLASLANLDVKRLDKGRHKIEVGFVEGGCCPQLVRAVIRNGMVTGFEVEPCNGASKRPPPPELLALIKQARTRFQRRSSGWKPVPVTEFVRTSPRTLDLIIIIALGCFMICCFGYCLMCCDFPRFFCIFGEKRF